LVRLKTGGLSWLIPATSRIYGGRFDNQLTCRWSVACGWPVNTLRPAGLACVVAALLGIKPPSGSA
jgi:hypothetical protein